MLGMVEGGFLELFQVGWQRFFWYFPFKDKAKSKIIKYDNKYTKYAAWGKEEKAKYKRDEVKIEHGKGEIKEEEKWWGYYARNKAGFVL